jgi:hypothetical protein
MSALAEPPCWLRVLQAEKHQKLVEIEQQLADTNSSVRQGKQLLGALAENYGNMVRSLAWLSFARPTLVRGR